MKYFLLVALTLGCTPKESLCYHDATQAYKVKMKECRKKPDSKTCKALASEEYTEADEECMYENRW